MFIDVYKILCIRTEYCLGVRDMMSSVDTLPMSVRLVFNTNDSCCSLYSTNVLLKSNGSFNLSVWEKKTTIIINKMREKQEICEQSVVVGDTARCC